MVLLSFFECNCDPAPSALLGERLRGQSALAIGHHLSVHMLEPYVTIKQAKKEKISFRNQRNVGMRR